MLTTKALQERFAKDAPIGPPDECWEWQGNIRATGYGRMHFGGMDLYPHRVSYEIHKGPIPENMTIDHICFTRKCVNPSHLRILSRSDNAKIQLNSLKEFCIRGHEFTRENTYIRPNGNGGRRQCRECNRTACRKYNPKRKVK